MVAPCWAAARMADSVVESNERWRRPLDARDLRARHAQDPVPGARSLDSHDRHRAFRDVTVGVEPKAPEQAVAHPRLEELADDRRARSVRPSNGVEEDLSRLCHVHGRGLDGNAMLLAPQRFAQRAPAGDRPSGMRPVRLRYMPSAALCELLTSSGTGVRPLGPSRSTCRPTRARSARTTAPAFVSTSPPR
jgi:hypothetical protein